MMADTYAQIGAEIRRRRAAIGLSQADLADRVKMGRTSITMIERGAQSLLVHQLIDIASALRTTPAAFLEKLVYAGESPTERQAPTEIKDLLVGLDRPVTRLIRR